MAEGDWTMMGAGPWPVAGGGGGGGSWLATRPWRSVRRVEFVPAWKIWIHRWEWEVGRKDHRKTGTAWTRRGANAAANWAFYRIVVVQDTPKIVMGGGVSGPGFQRWGGGGAGGGR